MGHGNSHDSGHVGHIVADKVFVIVLIALLILTVVTVAVSYVDMGAWNIVVAMLVASAKALTVALFFMHLKFEDGPTWLYAGIPLVLLAILLGGLFIDNPFRVLP